MSLEPEDGFPTGPVLFTGKLLATEWGAGNAWLAAVLRRPYHCAS